jgi:2-oxoisovalerate dehydrogenase E2 component (dihydrolipoyl transacylase)
MATTRVTMPQLGESVHEGTVSRWLVKPGDRVVEFEPMLEVDTDKVNTEVPAPVTGILKEILVPEGQTVAAGAEIAVVEVEGEGQASAEAAPAAEAAPSPTTEAASTAAAPATTQARPQPEHRYSPAVLMLAQEHGIDLSRVQGTGLGGRVTKRDVRRFLESQGAAASAAPAAPPTPTVPPPPAAPPEGAAPSGEDQVVPLTRMRRVIAENMVRSKATIPHAWQTQEVDMSGVVANRRANRAAFQEREGFSLTYLPYVVAAAAAALREHPAVNATFEPDGIVVHRSIHIGISVAAEDMLVVPVIRNADGLSIAGLARAINDLAGRARQGRLRPDELQGGTFTVNNSGTFGTLFSYSVINPGQAGILTMEAIVERPVAVGGLIGIKPMMYLCFSFDHRVLDGLQAARFLTSCRRWLEAVTAESPIY